MQSLLELAGNLLTLCADKVASAILLLCSPYTHPLTLRSVVFKKYVKNATLAAQPLQEMPIETVCAGNIYKGKGAGR